MYRATCIRVRPEMRRLSPLIRPRLSLPARIRPPLSLPPPPRNPQIAPPKIDLRSPAPDRPCYDHLTGLWVSIELARKFREIEEELSVYEFD